MDLDFRIKLIPFNYTTLSTRSRLRDISFIVLHTVAGFGSPYSWFKRIEAKASSHFFVSKTGEIEQYVPLYQVSWHAGMTNFDGNRNSIGIEFQDDNHPEDIVRTDKLYEAGSRLVALLCSRFSIPCVFMLPGKKGDSVISVPPGVYRHRDLRSGKSCPGGLDVDRIIRTAKDLTISDSDLINFERTVVVL